MLGSTWYTGAQSNNGYGSDRVFDLTDTAKVCGYVSYDGCDEADEKYRSDKSRPAFAFIWVRVCHKMQHEKEGEKLCLEMMALYVSNTFC